MNERIRQLAEQAGIYKLNLSDETEYWIMEKFAELIVKEMVDECAKVCVQHAGWTPDMIANQVKQYFGVEE
jgi:hypothetical protein